MVLIIESVVLCVLFTIAVYIMSREPIKTLYNYPPKIREKVKTLDKYKDKVPTQKNKIVAKVVASVLFLIILCVVLRYINGYTTFIDSFKYGLLLWTIVNLYDVIILDIVWFCHDSYFVFEDTEDMMDEYHNYWFHIKGFFIGEGLALIICACAAIIIQLFL